MPMRHIGVAVALALYSMAPLGAAAAESPLIEAVKSGDRAKVRSLLRERAPVNLAEPDGTTALHWAVRADDRETTQLLIQAGADVTAASRNGVTALTLAAMNGSAAIAEWLLKAGADPNTALPEGETVLMTAARAGDAATVRTFLSHGANVQAKEGWLGETALMLAAAENHPQAVAALVEAGADVEARSKALDLPKLQWGVGGMSTTVFPRGNWTALMFAAQQGAYGAAQVLAARGADLNQVDPDGTTALVLAIINAHYDVAAMLVEKGADPNIADTTGMAALYATVDMNTLPWMHNRPPSKPSGELGPVDLVNVLLAHGADPNARLKTPVLQKHHDSGDRNLGEGSTPLMRAAKAGDVTLMRVLLASGADPKPVQKNGTNALLIAAGVGRGNAGSYGRMSGSAEEAIEAVDILLGTGLDISHANADGQTALHGAAGRVDDVNPLIQFLADRGANPRVKNKRGQTALDIARAGAQVGTLRVLNDKAVELLSRLTPESAAAAAPDNKTQ